MPSFLCIILLVLISVSVSVLAQGTPDCRTLHCYENEPGSLIGLNNEVACPSGYSFPQACFNMYPGAVCDEPAGASFVACMLCYPPFDFVFFQICNDSAPSPNTPPSNPPPPNQPPPPNTPCPKDNSLPSRLCNGFDALDEGHTFLCFDNLPSPFVYGIATIVALLDLPLLPLVEVLVENVFEMCAAWVEVGGEYIEKDIAPWCKFSENAAELSCKSPMSKKSLAFDQDIDHILARSTNDDLNPCNDLLQNLTSSLSSFNFSEVTADCANLTANAQSLEASGLIDANDADNLISACAKVENMDFATAFINNVTSLTQNLQSLVQSCACPTVPDGTVRNATCYIESCPSGSSISSNNFTCV